MSDTSTASQRLLGQPITDTDLAQLHGGVHGGCIPPFEWDDPFK